MLLLINPPQIFSQYQVATGIVPPLGVAYLAALCEQEGIEVEIIDAVGEEPDTVAPLEREAFLRGMKIDDIVERVPQNVKLIGISNLFSFAFPAVKLLVEKLKEARPEVPIVLGGPHPSGLPEYTLEHSPAEYVILGEGEFPLLALWKHVNGEIPLEDVHSLAYRGESGEIIRSTMTPRIKDLNQTTIPFPARHLLPMENYISKQEAHGSVTERWTTILSSRGCPYGCTFCDSRRTKFIARSATDVVDEIEHCYNTYGITEFHFEDDNMTLLRDRTIELCDEIIGRGLKIRWQTPNGIRASVTNEEMLLKMRDSGCTHITLAPESGSERVLKEIIDKGRDFSLDQLLEVGRTAKKVGMKCAAYFILGLPGEKPEDIELTIKYANRLARAGIDEVAFGLFIPLPGTPMWDQVVEKQGMPDFLDLLVIGDMNRAVSWSDYLTEPFLNTARRKAYVQFHLNRMVFHPIAFWRTMLNVLKGVAETKTENTLRTFMRRARGKTAPSGGDIGKSEAGNYTPYDEARTVSVLMKSTAHYAYSNSALRAAWTVVSDFFWWTSKGDKLGRHGKQDRKSNT